MITVEGVAGRRRQWCLAGGGMAADQRQRQWWLVWSSRQGLIAPVVIASGDDIGIDDDQPTVTSVK